MAIAFSPGRFRTVLYNTNNPTWHTKQHALNQVSFPYENNLCHTCPTVPVNLSHLFLVLSTPFVQSIDSLLFSVWWLSIPLSFPCAHWQGLWVAAHPVIKDYRLDKDNSEGLSWATRTFGECHLKKKQHDSKGCALFAAVERFSPPVILSPLSLLLFICFTLYQGASLRGGTS